jgi:hypothetical protein
VARKATTQIGATPLDISELSQVFPADEASNRVGCEVVIETFEFEQIDEICAIEQQTMLDVGAAIGYRMKLDYPELDLEQFSAAFDSRDPRLYEYLSAELQAPTIDDLFYGHVRLADESADYRTVAELLIAVAYPGVVHIGDVEFSNPLAPLAEDEITRPMTRFKGLGLLGETIQRSVKLAQRLGLSAVCLTPAEHALVPLFEYHGFEIDQNELATLMRQAGMPGPMRMTIA